MSVFKQVIEQIKKDRIKTYQIVEFDLSTARSSVQFDIAGNYIYVLSLNGLVDLRFNELINDKVNLIEFRVIKTPFYRFFIDHTAQIGKTCKIAIGIETEFFEVADFGFTITQKMIEEATGVTLYNATCTLANTEYSQALNECRKFLIKPRNADLKVCFVSGQSGTNYLSLAQNQTYYEDLIHPSTLTLYFQSPTAGCIVEIIKWL